MVVQVVDSSRNSDVERQCFPQDRKIASATGSGLARSRARYLDIAAASLARNSEPLFPYALAHLRASEIASRSGVGRTALYKLWDSVASMWSDAIEFILITAPEPLEELGEWTSWPEMLDRAEIGLRHDRTQVLALTLLAYHRSERINELLRWRLERSVRCLTELIGKAFCEQGRRPLPLSLKQLAVVTLWVGQGLAHAGGTGSRVAQMDVQVNGEPHGRLAFTVDAMMSILGAPTDSGQRSVARDDGPIHTPIARALSPAKLRTLLVIDEMFHESLHGRVNWSQSETFVPSLTLQLVARKAGVTRQALQTVWGDQRRFSADLLNHLQRKKFGLLSEAFVRGMVAAALDPPRPSLLALDDSLGWVEEIASTTMLAHLAFTIHSSSPEVEHEITEAFENLADTIATQVEIGLGMVSTADAKPIVRRPGCTYFDLATIFTTAAISSARLSRLHPELMSQRVGRNGVQVRLAAVALEAIAAHILQTTPPLVLNPNG